MERDLRTVHTEKRLPRGIVIQHGAYKAEPAAFWAYLWTEDAQQEDLHWHDRLPVEGDWSTGGRAA